MPNRIIRESARRSDTLAQLSGDEERCFWRLTIVADDFGRFDGRAAIVRAECFQAMLETITTAAVEAWLARLATVGLIRRYVVEGKAYLAFRTWDKHQERRAKHSKYPEPPPDDGTRKPTPESASTCAQTPANVPEEREARNEEREARKSGAITAPLIAAPPSPVLALAPTRERKPPKKPKPPPVDMPEPFLLSDRMRVFAERGGLNAAFEFAQFKDRNLSRGERYVNWEAAWRTWCRNSVKWSAERRRG